MEGSRSQLWSLIEQITSQIYELQQQDGESAQELGELADKLERLLVLHKKYNEMEKDSNIRLLALMRERNLYLEKSRKIENLGQRTNWNDPLLQRVLKILYQNADEN
ncbi:unnamed protein product [Blepharisma stoltei]|uniref:EB1 C-terminal domain-containing protein n=1 Tax=Blepharisma stoltei TaxID=1481888 RepID=A0AAU9ILC8_9CILI|nr:unnamed protein product [Blepharisma stoltei]